MHLFIASDFCIWSWLWCPQQGLFRSTTDYSSLEIWWAHSTYNSHLIFWIIQPSSKSSPLSQTCIRSKMCIRIQRRLALCEISLSEAHSVISDQQEIEAIPFFWELQYTSKKFWASEVWSSAPSFDWLIPSQNSSRRPNCFVFFSLKFYPEACTLMISLLRVTIIIASVNFYPNSRCIFYTMSLRKAWGS